MSNCTCGKDVHHDKSCMLFDRMKPSIILNCTDRKATYNNLLDNLLDKAILQLEQLMDNAPNEYGRYRFWMWHWMFTPIMNLTEVQMYELQDRYAAAGWRLRRHEYLFVPYGWCVEIVPEGERWPYHIENMQLRNARSAYQNPEHKINKNNESNARGEASGLLTEDSKLPETPGWTYERTHYNPKSVYG